MLLLIWVTSDTNVLLGIYSHLQKGYAQYEFRILLNSVLNL